MSNPPLRVLFNYRESMAMRKFYLRSLSTLTLYVISFGSFSSPTAYASTLPSSKASVVLNSNFDSTSTYLKSNPFKITLLEKKIKTEITNDKFGNSLWVSEGQLYSQVDGDVYGSNDQTSTPIAQKIGTRLALYTKANYSKVNFSYWSSPANDNGTKTDLAQSNAFDALTPLAFILDSTKLATSKIKLSIRSTTKKYSWSWKAQGSWPAGKTEITTKDKIIIQASYYHLIKKTYQLERQYKLASMNSLLVAPKGPYFEYDQILADPEYIDYQDVLTIRQPINLMWVLILGTAVKNSNQGDFITENDITTTLNQYNNQAYIYTQYTQALETTIKSFDGVQRTLCSVLPADLTVDQLLDISKKDPEQLPFSITFQPCSTLGYNLTSTPPTRTGPGPNDALPLSIKF